MLCRIFLSFKKTYTLKTKQKIRPNNSSLVRFSNQSSPVTYSYGPATTGGIVLRSPGYASLSAAAAAAMGGGMPSWPRSARVRQYSLEYWKTRFLVVENSIQKKKEICAFCAIDLTKKSNVRVSTVS
jgi:hypothetical protein